MVKVAVAVSLVSKSGGDHCTGLSVFLADEDCSFTDVQRKVVAQLKVQLQCQKCILLYRGCEVSVCSRDMKIKHCCPASTSCPRFTAIYFKYEGDCLEVRLGPPIAHLEPPPDKSVSLMVNFDTVTALDLKHLIFHTTKRPVYTQRIARILFARGPRIFEYLGHPLNDHKTLTSQGIGNGDELSLSLPPLTRNTAYSHGLNMEGTCCNSFCCAYKQTVVSSHIPSSEPMQLYDQLVDSSYLYSYAVNPSCIYHHCPMCGKQSKIQSCGFTDCFWAYDSRQYGKNWQMEDICSSWQYVPKNKYHRFKLDTATWHNLVFIVRTAYDNPSADQQDMAAECQICYASAGADVVTACGCSFHPSCLTAWKRFQSKLGCSVCKGPISNLQITHQHTAEGSGSQQWPLSAKLYTIFDPVTNTYKKPATSAYKKPVTNAYSKPATSLQHEATLSARANAGTCQSNAAEGSNSPVATVYAFSGCKMLAEVFAAVPVACIVAAGGAVLLGMTAACLTGYAACKAIVYWLTKPGGS